MLHRLIFMVIFLLKEQVFTGAAQEGRANHFSLELLLPIQSHYYGIWKSKMLSYSYA